MKMNSSFEKYQKRRLISSYFSVVLSISLVLFLLGLLSLFIVNSKKLCDNFKEKIPMSVYFKDDTDNKTLKSFGDNLKKVAYINRSVFVSKEEAAKQYKDFIGEDFMDFLAFNPLQNSYDIFLKADYVTIDSIKNIKSNLRKNTKISDIVYDKQLVTLVNDNIKKISIWILIISGFILTIAFLLINSCMRLSIYSNRFIIKTMQMVGATKSFIRHPFVWRSIKLGIIGSLLAIMAVLGVLYYVDKKFPKLEITANKIMIVSILFGILFFGILITWISTFFATQRFLNLRTDNIY